ncbi:hypothetical protein [Geobacillus stearothermophilus]|uniref:hypothetical protein n=1 Tax=Geobacillus stearothermophilus TaxID=1422 RepID=UPI00066FC3AB|nr:hypothetical protein [Geobacillus stearothermophilus]KMY56778.1 hypothetical protein AA904_15445 [Geobacillus stearothermophilus]KMY61552.1 hypothetical protein AA905_08535 [Geobacillus stearothermophilus]
MQGILQFYTFWSSGIFRIGYRQVCRLTVTAADHHEALSILYRMFNVADLIPKNCQARFMGTGDIVLIDEGRKGQTYYRLCPDDWKRVERQLVC